MKIARYIALSIFYFQTVMLFGQDPNFSNFINNKIYYNPAYVGLDYGLRINLAYRRQWPNIPSKFQTFYTSFDQSLRNLGGFSGFGFIVASNTEGEGALQKISFGVPLTFKRLKISKYSIIQTAWMPSVSFNSINWDKFIFSGQLDPYYGNIYPSKLIPPDVGASNKIICDLINLGLVYRYEKTSPQANSTKFYRKFEVGLAGFHLEQRNQSFTNSKAPLPSKYVFITNYTSSVFLNYDGYMLVQPSFLCEWQWKMFSYMAGINTSFIDYNIDFGLWWRNRNINFRNTDAIVILFGYRFLIDKSNNTILSTSLSYDFTVSKLIDATVGSPEITIVLAFNNSSFFNDKPDLCDERNRLLNKKKRQVKGQ